MYYGFYYDWTYILVLIGVVLSLLASSQVKGTFAKYSKIRSYSGMTGREAAEQILRRNGIYDEMQELQMWRFDRSQAN